MAEDRKYFNVRKSENDPRSYRFIELQNKLKILLISDETADKAAAAINVHVGNFSDPVDVPGIAHFCEHMLFLGTDKYPVENDFIEFIAQNGGTRNASTSYDQTNYHLELKHSALDGALDRLSQFFLCPRFDEDSTDRELKAIESEHQKNILVDNRRSYMIDKFTSRKNHVTRKFGTGNLETLKTIPTEKGIKIRELLLNFYEKYYSSNIMSLVVVGRETLDDLEEMVVPKFQGVVNKNVVVPVYEEHGYGPDEIGVTLNIKTIKQMKTLQIIFPIPDYSKFYKEKPDYYVMHLIGHEGEGSLLSMLKKKSLVNELIAGSMSMKCGFDFFYIRLTLSEEGLSRTDEIIGIVFQYINLVKEQEPQEWIYEEIKTMKEIGFRFMEKHLPLRYAFMCSKQMERFEPEDVLIGPYLHERFRPDLIKEILSYLRPDNFRALLMKQDKDAGIEYEKIKYYDAEYYITKIKKESIKAWDSVGLNDELQLPHKNPFLPDSLGIKVEKKGVEIKGVPEMFKDTEMMRVWYKQDDSFFLPKASLKLNICSPMAHLTPTHVIHLTLFIKLLDDDLNEYFYDADKAGLHNTMCVATNGILLYIGGYDNKQLLYLKKILSKMINFSVKQERFNLEFEEFEQSLKNFETTQPYTQISEVLSHLMHERFWTNEDILKYLKDVSVSTLKSYISSFLKNIYIEILLCGNLNMQDVSALTESVEKILLIETKAKPLLPVQHLLLREYQLPEGCSYLIEKRNTIHSLSCVLVYFQVGLQEARNNVLSELFMVMVNSPAFSTLRTKEQLGYIVFSGLQRSTSVQGLKFLIQTDRKPAMVEKRIEAFLRGYKETLISMSNETFEDFVESLAVKKLDKPKRIGEEASRFWTEIMKKQYHFRRAVQEVEDLRKVKKEDIVEFYEKYVSPDSKQRKKVAMVMLGKDAESLVNGEELNNWYVIDDAIAFKSSLPLYPLISPFNGVPFWAGTKARL